MARIKYYYDTETCRYERLTISKPDLALNILGFIIVCFLCGFLILLAYMRIFDSPKEFLLKKENEELKQNYQNLNLQLANILANLQDLENRDNEIYRIVFEASPQKRATVENNPKATKFQNFLRAGFDQTELITGAFKKIKLIRAKIQSQQSSYGEILKLAQKKEQLLLSIPAIQPISNKHLKALASGYGMRIHPIYKVRKFHTGLDFSAVRGTPVYATGDGIARIPNNNDGYGNLIEITHGFGYLTRYAHLSRMKIRNGQRVKRGEVIGYVGSTGTATSPHLHYEVHKNGQIVNPIYYFFNDLSPKDYEQMIKLASVENQSLG
jgi:murein DD-endopeptidase MepM/ murein hydrolase activator NlpD